MTSERREKEARVLRYLEEHNFEALVLSRVENFAWLTAGGLNRIVTTEAAGAATLVYTRNGGKYVVTNVSEARRIEEEEVPEDWEVRSCRWDEDQTKLITLKNAVADTPDWGLPPATGFARLRYQLTPPEIERLRWLGAQAGHAVAEACRRHVPGETEHVAAARLHEALTPEGITPAVVLVSSDERLFRYRHPVPTAKPVDRYMMVVVVAEKWGLHAAATRFVSFGALSDELARKFDAVAKIDNVYIEATRPGAAVADILKQGIAAYKATGYAEEWQLHHQGGAIGYAPREYVATAHNQEVVLENQAFAWNPSITGAKTEDTILVTAHGHENLTAVADWPLIAGRPLPLIR